MPHTPSAYKELRKGARRRLRNRSAKSVLKTRVKKLLTTLESGSPETATTKEQMRLVAETLDKTASKGIIHWRTAARRKSRLTKRLNKLLSGSTPTAAHPPEAGKPQE